MKNYYSRISTFRLGVAVISICCFMLLGFSQRTEAQGCSVTLSSAPGSDGQAFCQGTVMDTIAYSTADPANTLVTGLPDELNVTYTDSGIIISGTPAEEGTYTYAVILSEPPSGLFAGKVCTDTVRGTITVLTSPIVGTSFYTQNVSFCTGSQVTISGTGADNYTWSNGISNGVPFRLLQTTTFSVTGTDNDGCQDTTSITISARPLPVPQVTLSSPVICPGGTDTITGLGDNMEYGWIGPEILSSGNNSIAVTDTTPHVFMSPNVNVYYAFVTAKNCTIIDTVAVRIGTNPFTDITPGPADTICAGNSITLSYTVDGFPPDQLTGLPTPLWSTGETTPTINVSAAGQYSVSLPNYFCPSINHPTTVAMVQTSPVFVAGTICPGGTYNFNGKLLNVAGQYNDTLTSVFGCDSVVILNLNQRPAPTATISGATTGCSPVALTAGGGVSYAWSGGNSPGSALNTFSSGGSYRVTVTDAFNCTAVSAPAVVTILPAPAGTVTAGGPTSVCSGTVKLTSGAGAAYSWNSGQTTRTVTFRTSGVYWLTVTGTNGCSAVSSQTLVSIGMQKPDIGVSAPTTFCIGESVTITAFGGVSYLWSSGQTTQSITVTTTGNYRVTATSDIGCTAYSIQPVSVEPLPAATIKASGPTTLCQGQRVTLTANAGTGYSYVWSDGETSQSIITGTTSTNAVAVTNSYGCQQTSAAKTVIVNPLPTANISANGSIRLCNDSVTLTANAGSGYKFAWSTGATTRSITVSTPNDYVVTVTNSSKCTASSSENVITQCGGGSAKTDDAGTESISSVSNNINFSACVYPNPYTGQFHLKVQSSSTDNLSIKFFDIAGQLMEQQTGLSYDTDVMLGNGYASGVYIVQVRQGDLSSELKVVKTD